MSRLPSSQFLRPALGFLAVLLIVSPSTGQYSVTTERVSQTPRGPNAPSGFSSMSADGRYVAFHSDASNLVAIDMNGVHDVFVRDLQTGAISICSINSNNSQPADASSNPTISADGRYVAFQSDANNLDQDDTNGLPDVYVRDIHSGTTTRVSAASDGSPGNGSSYNPSISADGRFVAFESSSSNLVESDTNSYPDVFVRDMLAGTTSLVSVSSLWIQGNGSSGAPSISSDGRFVAFHSNSSNLSTGDTNGLWDVFVRDTVDLSTVRASVSFVAGQTNGDAFYPSISGDGAYVAFESSASNLVADDSNGLWDAFVRDLQSGTNTLISVAYDGSQSNSGSSTPIISSDGRRVAFESLASNLVPEDTNDSWDVFVRDLPTATTERVSISSLGHQVDASSNRPSINLDGRYVTFESTSTDLAATDTYGLPNVFSRDLLVESTNLVSASLTSTESNGESVWPSISSDGKHIAFHSFASNLIGGDSNRTWDVYARRADSEASSRVSISSTGSQANGGSYFPSINADGRFVAFGSFSSNLSPGDPQGVWGIFVRDVETGTTSRASSSSDGTPANDSSFNPSISGDGRWVAFESDASNLVTFDTNATMDIFVRDVQAGTTVRASVSSGGAQANSASSYASLSSDGRYVAFETNASNLVASDTNGASDVILRDLQSGITTRVSVAWDGTEANGNSHSPSLSADGRFVAFVSSATNIVQGDSNSSADVFVRDLQSGTTALVSRSTNGTLSDGSCAEPSITADGRSVAFGSFATNLVPNDTNGFIDVFVREVDTGTTTRVSVASDGSEANSGSFGPSISSDGRSVAYYSYASNLVPDDANAVGDVFMARLSFEPLVSGKLLLLDYVGQMPNEATFEFRDPVSGDLVKASDVRLSTDGSYSTTSPGAGTWRVSVKLGHWLRRAVNVDVTGGDAVGVNFTLVNGDIDGDNAITVFDYTILSDAFDTVPGDLSWFDAADLDGDGAVTVFDYSILSQHFDMAGDW